MRKHQIRLSTIMEIITQKAEVKYRYLDKNNYVETDNQQRYPDNAESSMSRRFNKKIYKTKS